MPDDSGSPKWTSRTHSTPCTTRKRSAEPRGAREPAHEPRAVAGADGAQRPHERPARREQDDRVERRDPDGQPRLHRRRPDRRPQAQLEEGDDQAAEEHDLPAEEHQHAQARIRQRQALGARRRLAVAVAVVAARRSGRPAPAVRRPIAGHLAGAELDVEHGHERAQLRSQATAADASMRKTIQDTSTQAVRRFRSGSRRGPIQDRTPGGDHGRALGHGYRPCRRP